jgi:hypothetical protein
MSFDSNLEIAIIDGSPPNFSVLRQAILRQLDEDGVHHDVFAAVESAFIRSRSSFRLHPAYLLQLMDEIAPLFPEVSFDARGLGESFRETWVAEYRDGQRIYTQGPWDYA